MGQRLTPLPFLIMFETLTKKINAIKSITLVEVLHQLFLDVEFQKLIIRLNTMGEQTSQLAQGINSEKEKLSNIGGEYSDKTLSIARENNKPKIAKDVIDLHDTGYFYNSFKTYWTGKEIQITANTIKQSWDGAQDLIDRWGKDIIGLDEDNLGVLSDFAKTKIKQIVINQIKKAA